MEQIPSRYIKKEQGIILIEKNVVSTVGKERRPVAIGEEAYEMFEKVPPSINVSFPLSHGVVSKIDDMIALWNFMGAENITQQENERISVLHCCSG